MERELIAWLEQQQTLYPGTSIAIGDDCSLHPIPSQHGPLAVTTDLLIEGPHFDLASTDPQRVGHKALAVNLSDLAAMAARPIAFWVALVAPRSVAAQTAEPIVRALYQGMLELAGRFQMTLAGGDTNVGGDRWVVSITAAGQTSEHPWLRSAAQVGDRLLVTGPLGGSLLGHHLDFMPRVQEALELNREFPIRAAIDISDGLTLDLSRLLTASRVAAELELDRIPISPAACQMALSSGRRPLDHALADGEDFELLIAADPQTAASILARSWPTMQLTDIGSVHTGSGMIGVSGSQRAPLEPQGYWHGA